jgi:hypothetical protein
MNYIVKINKQWAGGILTLYIKRIFSYKKGKDGVILTPETSLAYKYKKESSAIKASNFYFGCIETIKE